MTVGISIKHQISKQTAQAIQKHALQVFRQGELVEEIGKSMLSKDFFKEEIGQNIKLFEKNIQEKALNTLKKRHKLEIDNSTEVFLESLQAHIDANRSHIKSVREFQKGLENFIRQKKNSQMSRRLLNNNT